MPRETHRRGTRLPGLRRIFRLREHLPGTTGSAGQNITPDGEGEEMTSIIWYIYNEYLKKERELVEKANKPAGRRSDHSGNGDEEEQKGN